MPLIDFFINVRRFFDNVRIFSKYTDSQKKELEKIRAQYESYIKPCQVEYFKLDESGKKPAFTIDNFRTAIKPDNESGNPNIVSIDCQSMSEEICIALESRLKGPNKLPCEEFNSPVVIFYVELLLWLKKMTIISLNETTLADINNRLDYLYDVLKSDVFSKEPDSWIQIDKVILSIISTFEKRVIPMIQKTLSQQTARDLLNDIKTRLNRYVISITNALFYLHTNHGNGDPSIFKQFDVNSIRNRIAQQENELKNTRLHNLFLLVNPEQPGSPNLLLDASGKIVPSLTAYRQKTIYSDDQSLPLGLHKDIVEFSKEHQGLEMLISALGFLYNLKGFVTVFEQASEIAGETGNLGLYMFLGNELDAILNCFLAVLSKIEDALNRIKTTYEECFRELTFGGNRSSWKSNYLVFIDGLRKAEKDKISCLESLYKLRNTIQRTATREYQLELKQKIQDFRKSVGKLVAACETTIVPSDYVIVAHSDTRAISSGDTARLIEESKARREASNPKSKNATGLISSSQSALSWSSSSSSSSSDGISVKQDDKMTSKGNERTIVAKR